MTVVFAKKQVSGFRRATHKLTSFKQIQTILHDFLRICEPVCRVWQNSTRSRACKAVFRPLIISYKFLKNLARAPAVLCRLVWCEYFNFRLPLSLFYLCFCLVSIDRSRINKQMFFLSCTERIFIQTRRLSANRSVKCFCVAPYENFAVNRKASIFVSYVIKEFAHAFS